MIFIDKTKKRILILFFIWFQVIDIILKFVGPSDTLVFVLISLTTLCLGFLLKPLELFLFILTGSGFDMGNPNFVFAGISTGGFNLVKSFGLILILLLKTNYLKDLKHFPGIYLFFTLSSFLWLMKTPNIALGLKFLIQFCYPLLLFCAGWSIFTTRDKVMLCLKFYFSILVLATVVQFLLYPFGLHSVAINEMENSIRWSFSLGNVQTGVVFGSLVYLLDAELLSNSKKTYLFYLLLPLPVIFLTGSRLSLVAYLWYLLSGIFFSRFRFKSLKRTVLLSFLGIYVLSIGLLRDNRVVSSIDDAIFQKDIDQFASGRFTYYNIAMDMIEKNSLFGYGLGAEDVFIKLVRGNSAVGSTTAMHNEYLRITAIFGFIGTTIFWIGIIQIIVRLIKFYNKSRDIVSKKFISFGIVGWLFFLIEAFFSNPLASYYTSMTLYFLLYLVSSKLHYIENFIISKAPFKKQEYKFV